jgi:PAS domain S-box-containing protein
MKAVVSKINREGRGVLQTISASKDTEAVLLQEYQTIFKSNGKPMVIVDEDTTICLANAEFERLSGYTKKEIEGTKKWAEFVAREDRRRMKEYHLLRKSDPMLTPRCCEFRFVDKNGKIKNIMLTIGQIPGTTKSMASLQDVTNLRQAEVTLQASEERYQTFFENSRDAVYITTRDGSYVDANRAALDLFGYTREEMKKLKARQLYANAADAQRLRKEIEEKGFAQDFEVRLCKKDGSEMDCLFTVTALRGDDGSILEYQGIARDVTERKRAEQALRESEEKYRDIFDSMLEGYFEVDLTGNITFFNEAVSKFFGYSSHELRGLNYQKFASSEGAQRLLQVFSEVFTTGNPHEIDDYEIVKKDGSIGMAEFSVSLLRNTAGEPIGFRGVTRDVTEKRKTRETLRESEDKYRNILENITEGYFENDLRGNLTFFNDSLVAVYGYTRDELMHMDYRQYMDEENAHKVFQAYNTVYTTGKPDREIQFEIIRKDGTKKYLENSVSLMRDVAGQPVGFQGISRDITGRKKVEESLRENEEKYRSMLDNIGDAYTETDLAGRVTFFNKAISASLGYTGEEFVGMHYKKYTAQESVQKIYEIYNKVYRTGETSRAVELTYIAKDGTKKILESTVLPMRDKSGKPIGFRTFTADITLRRLAEEALRQSEERYRTILENMQEAYYETDLAGHFTFVNEAICQHLGYSKEELIGTKNRQYQDEASATKTYQAFNELSGTGEPVKAVESEFIKKDGTKGTYEMSASLIRDEQGKPIGFRGVSRDVTERKKAEEQLKRYAAELERSNEEVKNFAYIVSHDLRVPLVNLKGYTSELRSALGVIGANFEAALPHLNDEKRSEVAIALHEDVPEALEFITNSVSRMDSFINAILILSRLGRQDLKLEPIDMNALVQAALESMSHQIKEQGIEVYVGSLPQIVADHIAMERIMGNILSNAVKYVDPERPCRIEVVAGANNGETIFTIQDTGRGIAQDDMHKVFAPFRRAGKQDTQGEGMGLAYVQTLVRRLGGRIWCDSEPGKGTTFTFTISSTFKQGATDA